MPIVYPNLISWVKCLYIYCQHGLCGMNHTYEPLPYVWKIAHLPKQEIRNHKEPSSWVSSLELAVPLVADMVRLHSTCPRIGSGQQGSASSENGLLSTSRNLGSIVKHQPQTSSVNKFQTCCFGSCARLQLLRKTD